MKKYYMFFVLAAIMCACSSDDEKAIPTLDVSSKKIEAPAAGITADISVTSNGSWTVLSDATDWCKVSPASGTETGTVKVTVLPNPSLLERTATVNVKSGTLEKSIEVVQAAAGLNEIMIGKWEMTQQNSGDANYNDLVGLNIEFKTEKKAVATLDVEIPGVGFIDKIEGNWKIEDKLITIDGSLGGSMDVKLTLNIDEMSEEIILCHLNINLPGLFPQNGIPVIFEKL